MSRDIKNAFQHTHGVILVELREPISNRTYLQLPFSLEIGAMSRPVGAERCILRLYCFCSSRNGASFFGECFSRVDESGLSWLRYLPARGGASRGTFCNVRGDHGQLWVGYARPAKGDPARCASRVVVCLHHFRSNLCCGYGG